MGGVFPLNADGSATRTGLYRRRSPREDFADIEAFFAREAQRYGVTAGSRFTSSFTRREPSCRRQLARDAGLLGSAWWSLKMRWFAATRDQVRRVERPRAIRIFVLYHDPARSDPCPTPTACRKGLVGSVHAFAVTRI